MRGRSTRWALGLLLLLLAVGLVGCGGGDSESDRTSVGDPVVATNDPAGEDVGKGEDKEGGVVVGEPSLEDLDRLPPAGVGSAGGACAGTQLEPGQGNFAGIASATLCLLNAERASRSLRPLRANRVLARAALRHSREMVAKRYFAHVSPSGVDFVSRIRSAGYLRGARAWTLGENIAWGSGNLATPVEIVRGWMASRGHKANILNGRFREIGIGIASGVPLSDVSGPGATYNTGFGARS